MKQKNLICVNNLCYAYPNSPLVLKDLNFTLGPRECLGLVGPNGAGKTTFLHILMGLLSTSHGVVELFGIKPATKEQWHSIRLRIGFLFQHSDDQLFCPTVLDDVAFGPLNQGLSKKEAKKEALKTLEKLGLENFEDRVPYHLSGGEKKLVALASILAMRPQLLILDEPTTGLSPTIRKKLVQIINDLGMPRLVVSHDTDFLLNTTETILVLENGRIEQGQLKTHSHTHVQIQGDALHSHGKS